MTANRDENYTGGRLMSGRERKGSTEVYTPANSGQAASATMIELFVCIRLGAALKSPLMSGGAK